MNRRYFWLIPEFVKFRAVFETAETVLGVSDANEHRLFRKDTGKICFDESEALRVSIVRLNEPGGGELFAGRSRTVFV